MNAKNTVLLRPITDPLFEDDPPVQRDHNPDAELLAWIDQWNALPRSRRGPDCRREPISPVVRKAWRRRETSSELQEITSDPSALMAAVARCTFCHGKPWFVFGWLFGKGQSGEWNSRKVLDGYYVDQRLASGVARVPVVQSTVEKIKSRTLVVAGGKAPTSLASEHTTAGGRHPS
jgi:hypothetical protein